MATFEFGDQPDYYDTDTMDLYIGIRHASTFVQAGEGYGGAKAWSAGAENAYAAWFPLVVHPTQFGFVIRCRVETLPSGPSLLLAACDQATGSPPGPGVQVCCALNADGTISIYRGDPTTGTLLSTSTVTVPMGAPAFRLAFQGVISPTAGSAVVSIAQDGGSPSPELLTPITQVGGVNTDFVNSGVRRGVMLGAAPDVWMSYFYCQGAGTLPEDPLCDVVMPEADSNLMEWFPQPDNNDPYENIDEIPHDFDDTYIYSEEINARFAVKHANVPIRIQTLGARFVAVVRDEASEVVTYTPLMRSAGGANELGAATSVYNDDYIRMVDHVASLNPFTGLPWTSAQVNASFWGGQTTP